MVYTGNTASWEEASACYYCQQQMREVGTRRAPRNITAKIHVLQCMNDDCPYYRKTMNAARQDDPTADGDRWNRLVERMADGTIPIRPQGLRGKELPRMPRISDEAVTRMQERIQAENEFMEKLSKHGGQGARLDPESGRIIRPPED